VRRRAACRRPHGRGAPSAAARPAASDPCCDRRGSSTSRERWRICLTHCGAGDFCASRSASLREARSLLIRGACSSARSPNFLAMASTPRSLMPFNSPIIYDDHGDVPLDTPFEELEPSNITFYLELDTRVGERTCRQTCEHCFYIREEEARNRTI